MTILDQIVADKHQEVAERQSLVPQKKLEKSIYFKTPSVSLKKYLLREDKLGIIAEFKRHSPSKGDINPYAKVEEVTIGYMQAGASALSVLTDTKFFKGSSADLTEARKFNFCPILRKDFIVNEYQLLESKSMGADVILLIAECLEKKKLKQLAKTAKNLGLEVLMEVHSEEQLDKYCDEVDVVGVNNRDLKTFKVSIQNSLRLLDKIPQDVIKISESGINDPNAVYELRRAGFQGFLMGEHFMKTAMPHKTCADFIKRVKSLEDLYDNAIA